MGAGNPCHKVGVCISVRFRLNQILDPDHTIPPTPAATCATAAHLLRVPMCMLILTPASLVECVIGRSRQRA